MYAYSLQLNWPSLYEPRAWGYEPFSFESITLLSKEEILKKLPKKMHNEICDIFYMMNIPKDDSKLPYSKEIPCNTEKYSCFITILKDDATS